MEAWRYDPYQTFLRIEMAELMSIADQQVEARIAMSLRDDLLQVFQRRLRAAQESFGQRSSGGMTDRVPGVADIGQCRKAPAGTNPHPGSTGFQVASGDDGRTIVPRGQRQGRAVMIFVAIGGDD